METDLSHLMVPQELLGVILEAYYQPQFRYLKEAILRYPKAEGTFTLGDTFYTNKPLGYLTVPEAKLCLDQLACVAFGIWLEKGNFKDAKISFDTYLRLLENGKSHTRDFQMKFREQMRTSEPIKGQISLADLRTPIGKYVGFFDCAIGNGKNRGKLKYVLEL